MHIMFRLLCSQLQYNVRLFERKMAFYAVAKGRKVGIYDNWTQCEQQVKGFKGAIYKKFKCLQDAKEFINPSGAKGNYAPHEVAVALGQKEGPPTSWQPQKQQHVAEGKDYWPEDIDEKQEVTDDDLVGIICKMCNYTHYLTSCRIS